MGLAFAFQQSVPDLVQVLTQDAKSHATLEAPPSIVQTTIQPMILQTMNVRFSALVPVREVPKSPVVLRVCSARALLLGADLRKTDIPLREIDLEILKLKLKLRKSGRQKPTDNY